MYKILSVISLFAFFPFCFSQVQNELMVLDKLELNKNYKLNFKYNYNNMNRFDINIVSDLEIIKKILNENPDLIAMISVKINQKGNEKFNQRVTNIQKNNIEKEATKLNIIDNVKILSLGNKYFKQGYNFYSNLDVMFFQRGMLDGLNEDSLINVYLNNNNFVKNDK